MRQGGIEMDIVENRNVSTRNFSLDFSSPVSLIHDIYRNRTESQYDMHYCVEMGIVLKGKMKRSFPGYEKNFSSGDVWFCGIWEPHGYKVVLASTEVLVFVIYPPMLAKFNLECGGSRDWLSPFKSPPEHRPSTSAGNREHVINVCRQVLGTEKPSQPHLSICALNLLVLLTRGWEYEELKKPSTFGYYEIVGKAIDLVFRERHFLKIEGIAGKCGVSRNHFSRIFMETMGTSFAKFALNFRLNNAAYDMCNTMLTMDEIAIRNGFSDASHLCHRFTGHFGVSPSQYKQRRIGKGT